MTAVIPLLQWQYVYMSALSILKLLDAGVIQLQSGSGTTIG